MEPPVLRPYREGLRNWLRTATKRLCIEAKWRVYQEILAHHAETVDAHREEGLSDDEAHDCALASLGPPRKAARDFRRTHLTVRQAKRLQKVLDAEEMAVLRSKQLAYTYKMAVWPYAGFVAIFTIELSIHVSRFLRGSTEDFWELGSLDSVAPLIMVVPVFLMLRRQIAVQRRRHTSSGNDPVQPLSANEVVSAYISQSVYQLWLSLFYSAFLVSIVPRDSAFLLFATGALVLFNAAAAALLLLTALLHLPVRLKLRRGAVFTDPRGRQG